MTTVETVILLSTNSCKSSGVGGEGSPSEIMIKCLAEASLPFRPARAMDISESKLGMSLGLASLILVAIRGKSATGVSGNIQPSPPLAS